MSRKIFLFLGIGLLACAIVFGLFRLRALFDATKANAARAAQVMRQSISALEKQHDEEMKHLRTELLLAGLEKETALHTLRNRDADAYDHAKDSVFFLAVQSEAFAADEKTVLVALQHSASGSVFQIDDVTYFATSSHAVTTVKFPVPRVRVVDVSAYFLNGDSVELDVLGYSKECDVVLLTPKDRSREYGKPLKLAAHDAIRRGMRVMSLGAIPSGRITWFTTYGEVNAIDVAVGNEWLPRLVISSPYMLHGFSGGPLIAVDTGEMIGLNGRSKDDNVTQVPLSLPSEAIRAFLPRLVMPGRMHHGATGATLEDDPNSVASLRVRNVATRSPADGKLQNGDLITAIDGSPVRSLFYAELRVLAAAPGTTMCFAGTRDGKDFVAELVLASLDK